MRFTAQDLPMRPSDGKIPDFRWEWARGQVIAAILSVIPSYEHRRLRRSAVQVEEDKEMYLRFARRKIMTIGRHKVLVKIARDEMKRIPNASYKAVWDVMVAYQLEDWWFM